MMDVRSSTEFTVDSELPKRMIPNIHDDPNATRRRLSEGSRVCVT
jgi:hypothetical protein